MNRADALAKLNATMLGAYSARTTSALRGVLPLRLALPHLEPILALNTEKETRKDALVIAGAAKACARGVAPGVDDARVLFLETKAIDDAFLRRVSDFPVRVVIRYEEIEALRTRRIFCLVQGAYRVLSAWDRGVRLRRAMQSAYSQSEFEWLLEEMFELYARETRALSRSLQLPALIAPLRDRIAEHLLGIMRNVAARIAHDVARGVYVARTPSALRQGRALAMAPRSANS